jgi:hypothetical protein
MLQGRNVGDLLNEAVRVYLARVAAVPTEGGGSLRALKPESFPEGSERLSRETDSCTEDNLDSRPAGVFRWASTAILNCPVPPRPLLVGAFRSCSQPASCGYGLSFT